MPNISAGRSNSCKLFVPRIILMPLLLLAGLLVGYSGDLPVIDKMFGRLDLIVFESVRWPSLFLFFAGLTFAWLIHPLVQWLFRRKPHTGDEIR